MKGPDRVPSSYMLPAAAGPVLLRPSGLDLVRPLHAFGGFPHNDVSIARVPVLEGLHVTSLSSRPPYRSLRAGVTLPSRRRHLPAL